MWKVQSIIADASFVLAMVAAVIIIVLAIANVERDPNVANAQRFERSWWVILPETAPKEGME